MKKSRQLWYDREIAAQRKWIDEHGRTLSGYVERYGSKDDPEHYGSGGEEIYAADTKALENLERQAGRR